MIVLGLLSPDSPDITNSRVLYLSRGGGNSLLSTTVSSRLLCAAQKALLDVTRSGFASSLSFLKSQKQFHDIVLEYEYLKQTPYRLLL